MTPPKHLWAGDWEQESARAARARGVHVPAAADEPPPQRPVEPPSAPPAPGARQAPRPPGYAIALALLAVALVIGAVALARSGGSSGTGNGRGAATPTVPGFIAPPSPPAASTPSSVTGARAWLGLQMDYWPAGGAFVSDVSSGSPAAAAGLQQGDVIVKVDGQDVNGPGDVVQAIDAHKPGDSLSMQVQRGLDTVGVHVTLAQRPAGLQSQYP